MEVKKFVRAPPGNVGFCPMNDNQNCHQKGRSMSVCTCGHSQCHLKPDILQILFMDFFHQTVVQVQICFSLINDNQDGGQNGYPFFIAGYNGGRGSLSETDYHDG